MWIKQKDNKVKEKITNGVIHIAGVLDWTLQNVNGMDQ